MIKIVTIIGARPQIIKAAAISRAIQTYFPDKINEIIVHTGQHYDDNMSNVFFDELDIPRPKYNLNVGSSSHGSQTAKMIEGIEEILLTIKPDYILLYGDTNSTLAGAIAASKIHIPVIHVEAGLRSYNKKMPEEINRILTDHCSTFLFPPTQTGLNNLIHEGFATNSSGPYNIDNPRIVNLGDVMLDNSLYFSDIAHKKSSILNTLNIQKDQFILCTIHRNDNTDDPARLEAIFQGLNQLSMENKITIVVPLHPRTKKNLEKLNTELTQKMADNQLLLMTEPVSFLDIIILEKFSKIVITDSGGVQKEAYFFGKPCLIVRNETEWIEIVEAGMAYLVEPHQILNKAKEVLENYPTNFDPFIFGDGQAAKRILEEILSAHYANNL
jgi:UDP-GlcNAc3NAcA epimerase